MTLGPALAIVLFCGLANIIYWCFTYMVTVSAEESLHVLFTEHEGYKSKEQVHQEILHLLIIFLFGFFIGSYRVLRMMIGDSIKAIQHYWNLPAKENSLAEEIVIEVKLDVKARNSHGHVRSRLLQSKNTQKRRKKVGI